MQFIPAELSGAFVIEPQPLADDRGAFTRIFCSEEFAAAGLETKISQCSVSFNHRRGTLRGLHFQAPPHEETKLVRCPRGAIYDVIVDLRRESPTFLRWMAVELSEQNGRMLYVPRRFAHGFQALADDSEVFYQISEAYAPAHAMTIRWNDPRLAIAWPLEVISISQNDRTARSAMEALASCRL